MFYDEGVLSGAIDLHIHVGPDYCPRYADSIKLAREATNHNMKAIIIKAHLASTVASAHAANEVVAGTKVFGGITLNEPTGGLSPRTVLATIKTGGKMVWLPTVDATYAYEKAKMGHWIKHYVDDSTFGFERNLISIIDEKGKIKPEMHEILRLCKEYNNILGSGHISPQECILLAKECKAIGYKNFEITHPNAWLEDFTLSILKELIDYGATLTLSYGVCSPQNGRQSTEDIAAIIKEVGAESCCLITDYGQISSPSPGEGLRVFYYQLYKHGITNEELNLMLKENPSRLLSI